MKIELCPSQERLPFEAISLEIRQAPPPLQGHNQLVDRERYQLTGRLRLALGEKPIKDPRLKITLVQSPPPSVGGVVRESTLPTPNLSEQGPPDDEPEADPLIWQRDWEFTTAPTVLSFRPTPERTCCRKVYPAEQDDLQYVPGY